MKLKLILLAAVLRLVTSFAHAQITDTTKKHFVGSTLFTLANLVPNQKEPPKYLQLNYGYRINPKNVLSVEAITWNYYGPLGRQYGPDFENPESNFPGRVRAIGVGLAYKRFLWKGLYGQVHSTSLHQTYLDEEGEKIQNGFQLFNSLRLGYQVRFFKQWVFLEPSVACTWWPINTNLPASFQAQEDRFPSFFLFEPGLHFGINF